VNNVSVHISTLVSSSSICWRYSIKTSFYFEMQFSVVCFCS